MKFGNTLIELRGRMIRFGGASFRGELKFGQMFTLVPDVVVSPPPYCVAPWRRGVRQPSAPVPRERKS